MVLRMVNKWRFYKSNQVFTTFAPASRFIGLTITVSQESPGNAGRRAS